MNQNFKEVPDFFVDLFFVVLMSFAIAYVFMKVLEAARW